MTTNDFPHPGRPWLNIEDCMEEHEKLLSLDLKRD